MEPKFQSSFIPKGPIATSGSVSRLSRESNRGLLGTLAIFVFTFSVLISLGVFGYELLLKANINKMGGNLASAKASLEPDKIVKIANLDERIVSTGELLENHVALSPLFDYLEASTLKTVRFSDFRYDSNEKGLMLSMRGQARGYAAVALQSEIFNQSQYIKQPIFSDLDLDEKGNVTFTFRAVLDPSFISYKKATSGLPIPETQTQQTPVPVVSTTTGSTNSPQAKP